MFTSSGFLRHDFYNHTGPITQRKTKKGTRDFLPRHSGKIPSILSESSGECRFESRFQMALSLLYLGEAGI
jgi:hypothetical protein